MGECLCVHVDRGVCMAFKNIFSPMQMCGPLYIVFSASGNTISL